MQFAYAMVLIKNFDPLRFGDQDVWSIFRPHTYPGVVKLLRAGRRNDAISLLAKVNRIATRKITSLVLLLVLVFGGAAVTIIRLINRADRYFVPGKRDPERSASSTETLMPTVSGTENIPGSISHIR